MITFQQITRQFGLGRAPGSMQTALAGRIHYKAELQQKNDRKVLAYLARHGVEFRKDKFEIAAGVDMSHHNMQQILARLIIRGWVDSKLIKRGSTRVKYYWLTEYGQQYFEGLR